MVQNYTIYNVQVRIIENITKLNVPLNPYIAIISNENNRESLPIRFIFIQQAHALDFAHTDYRRVGEVFICSQYAACIEVWQGCL